jgi:hypothetical protein
MRVASKRYPDSAGACWFDFYIFSDFTRDVTPRSPKLNEIPQNISSSRGRSQCEPASVEWISANPKPLCASRLGSVSGTFFRAGLDTECRSRAHDYLRSSAPPASHQQSTYLDHEHTREVEGRMHPSRTPRESLLETSPVAGIPHTVALAEQFDHSILNDPVPATRATHAHEYAGDEKAEAGDGAGSGRSESRSRSRSRFPFKSRTRQSSQDGMVTDELLKPLPLRCEYCSTSILSCS